MFLAANCLVSFLSGCAQDSPETAKFIGKCAEKRHRISGVVGKEQNIGFVGFLGNVKPKWCRKDQK